MTSAYAYRALRPTGDVERGTIAATSDAEALAALDRAGLLALEVRFVASARDRRAALPPADLALGLRILGDLLSAGLPLTRALQAMDDLVPPRWRPLLPPLREAVREGKSLATALRDAPAEIPALVIGMTLAGEMAGDVGPAVRRAAEVTEFIAETRTAIRSALAYPLLLVVAGTGAITIMVTVVIPRFAVILADLGQSLPASTRVVMAGASALHALFLPGLGVAIATAAALRAFTTTRNGKRRWHEALLRVPLLGVVRDTAATARASLTLATLLDAGVPLRHALGFAAQATGDAAIESRVLAARARVEAGERIARALGEHRAFTPVALRLVHAGEESGHLADMLRHASKLEQARGDRLTRTFVRLLEPVLVLTFAGIVALVAAALLQAVYSVRPTT